LPLQPKILKDIIELSNEQIREQMEDAKSLPILLLEAINYLRLFYQEQSLPESGSDMEVVVR
jgi:hypothetical protein